MLRGQKTFISNAPYADVIVVYAKMEHGELPLRERPIHAFVLERGAKGLTLGKPMKKMGMWSSPTGEIFLDDVFVPADQLLGEKEKEPSREGARDVFHGERTGMVPMCFGIIERCLEESLRYAKERKTWDTDHRRVPARAGQARADVRALPERPQPALQVALDAAEGHRDDAWARRAA